MSMLNCYKWRSPNMFLSFTHSTDTECHLHTRPYLKCRAYNDEQNRRGCASWSFPLDDTRQNTSKIVSAVVLTALCFLHHDTMIILWPVTWGGQYLGPSRKEKSHGLCATGQVSESIMYECHPKPQHQIFALSEIEVSGFLLRWSEGPGLRLLS